MKTFVSIVDKIVRILIVLFFSAIIIIGLMQIISRYAFSLPIVLADEAQKYLFIWMVMIAAAYGIRKKKHVAADVVLGNVGPRVKAVMEVLIELVSLALFILFIVLAPRMIRVNIATISPTLGIPMGYVYYAMLIGPILMLFYTIVDIYEKYILKHPLGGDKPC